MATTLTPAEFAPAPEGTRVRVVTWLVASAVVLVNLLQFALLPRSAVPWWVPILAFGMLLPLLFVFWFGSRIRAYRLEGGELQIVRAFRTVRFPLANLQEVGREPQAMRGAWKIYGNDGLGAIAGRYRSKRLGGFRAYLTDTDRAVVLRWPKLTVVISPAQSDAFIAAAKARANPQRAMAARRV